MDWASYINGQEAAELGRAMMAELAEEYGCEATEAAIKRAVYDATSCGAWVRFPEDAPARVEIGSIVEGSDAEVGPYDVTYTLDDNFIERWRQTVLTVDGEAHELWMEASAGGYTSR